MNKLKLGFPKGSLQESTLDLFRKAGIKIKPSERSYFPTSDDDELEIMMVRSQTNLGASQSDRDFERALHVAESGIADTLHRLSQDAAFTTGEVSPGSFSSGSAEEAWARSAADSAATADPVNASICRVATVTPLHDERP